MVALVRQEVKHKVMTTRETLDNEVRRILEEMSDEAGDAAENFEACKTNIDNGFYADGINEALSTLDTLSVILTAKKHELEQAYGRIEDAIDEGVYA